MSRRALFLPLILAAAAAAGAGIPLAGCGASDANAGAYMAQGGSPGSGGAESSSGSAVGGGGGNLSDAAVDVLLNADDPPPFTGKSYCDKCGGTQTNPMDPSSCSLPCDLSSGSCSIDGGPTPMGEGCKLTVADGGDTAAATCAASGTKEIPDSCTTSADCAAGFGCVGKAPNAFCRPYCCGDVEDCPAHTWCVPERMSEAPDVKIPVCVDADECSLLDDQRPCHDGLTCTIVRGDGTTACVQPGTGTQGEHCACAPDYVCSQLADKCFKLCHIVNDGECPSGAHCVGGQSGYPQGIGECVGGGTYSP